MDTVTPEIADRIIDALDGTSAVARLLKLPISTVHSWRRIGMAAARADHLRLAAQSAGKVVDFVKGEVRMVHDDAEYSGADPASCGTIARVSA